MLMCVVGLNLLLPLCRGKILFQIDLSNFQYTFTSIGGQSLSNFGHSALIGCLSVGVAATTHIHVLAKVLLSGLILLLEVCNEQSAYGTYF